MGEYLDDVAGLTREASPCLCRYIVDHTVPGDLAERVIAGLSADRVLGFYDPYYPSPSDPGAYVGVRQFEGRYVYSYGNHGWHSGWERQSREFLTQYLALCLPAHRGAAGERLSINRVEPIDLPELLKGRST